jgi:hypothetical protein
MAVFCIVIQSIILTMLRDTREAKRGGTAPGEQRVPKQPQGNSAQGGAGMEKYELSKIY